MPSNELLTTGTAGIILKSVLNAPSSCEMSGRDVRSCQFCVATGRNGRGKRHDDGEGEVRHRDRRELRPLIRIRSLSGKDAKGMAVAVHTAFGRGRLGAVSPPQPVVVDAARLELALHRRHDHPDILDHRGGFLRGRRVHGLLRLPLSPQGGKAGSLQSRKQEAGMVADDRDCNRRRGHVGTRTGRLAPVRHRSGRCDRGRGHGAAVAMELPASRKGRPAWDLRCRAMSVPTIRWG